MTKFETIGQASNAVLDKIDIGDELVVGIFDLLLVFQENIGQNS